MIYFLVSFLIVVDLALIFFVFKLNRGRINQADLLREITDERHLLADLRKTIDNELKNYSHGNKYTLDRITKIATEAELEVKNGGETIRKELSVVADEISNQLETPLKELASRQVSISKLVKEAKEERIRLVKVIQKAEVYSKYFEQEINYSELTKTMEEKKHKHTLELLSRGVSPLDVSKEVGLPVAEVKIIAGLR